MNPKEVSDDLIINGKKPFNINRKFNNMKLYNYDTIVAMESLKKLEGMMGEMIKESDVDFLIDRKLTQSEMDETIKYCTHDVEQTIKVFELTKSDFDAIIGMITMFNLPMDYVNKTKAQLTAIVLGAEKNSKFKNEEFDYEFLPCLKMGRYEFVKEHYDKNRSYKVVNDKGKLVSNGLKFDCMGMKTTTGFGGIHASIDKTYFEGFIIHSDVSSYYPNLMIQHKLLSRTIQEPKKYEDILHKRLELKHAGKKKEQAPYKIILNGTFGICKDKWSLCYDPKRANEITVNGQLGLLDLVDKLENEFGDDIKGIQLNTDGIIMMLRDPDDFDRYKSVCKEWEDRMKLSLEHDVINRIYQGSVNGYVFEFANGKLERKGALMQETNPLKNDISIIGEAVVEYFINNTPIEDTINNCNELIKFQKICKIGSTYDYGMWGEDKLNERVLRIFATKDDTKGGVFKVKCNQVNKNGEVVDSISKLADTPEHSMIILNNVQNETCPDWLDKNYYIEFAKKKASDFIKYKFEW